MVGTRYDVAIVLGAKLRPDGRPSAAMRRRVAVGVRLVRDGEAEHLLLTGGVVGPPPAEAWAMHALARDLGVPDHRIVLEDRARRTLENARFSAPILAARGWTKAVVVSDGVHLPRALMTFRAFGVQAAGRAAWPAAGEVPVLAAARAVLREAVGLGVYGWLILSGRAVRQPVEGEE